MDRTTRLRHLALLSMAVTGAAWMAACTTSPFGAPAPAAPAPAATSAPEPTAAPLPPSPAATPAAAEPHTPATPAAAQQAQRLALAAIELLEGGHEDQALVDIERALQADPANRLAQSLQRQVQTDPQQLLGREYFTYRVEPGESLSLIAGRFLRDVTLFYALARYNDIRVPRQVQGGQLIKVPGRPTTPAAPATPTPPASPAPAPAAPVAPPPAPPRPAPPPIEPRAPATEAVVAQEYRRGLALMAQQKPAEAIQAFDKVLELEAGHANAKLKRAQALGQVNGLIRLLDNNIRRLDARLAQDPGNAGVRAERDKAVADRERLSLVR